MYHLHTLRHMSYVYLQIFHTREGNTTTIEAPFLWSGCGRVVQGARHKSKRLVLQCINGVSTNPVERRTKFDSSKNIMLTLLGLIFIPIYIIQYLPSIKSNFEIPWDRCSVWLSPAQMSYVYLQIFHTREGNTVTIEAPFFGVDVVEWSRALDIKLSDWCCSVSMV